jgi:hypothetical protein
MTVVSGVTEAAPAHGSDGGVSRSSSRLVTARSLAAGREPSNPSACPGRAAGLDVSGAGHRTGARVRKEITAMVLAQTTKRATSARLLACGVAAGPLFLAVWAVQAFTREGFDPTYHPISLLSLGDLGWIQIANFVVTGALYLAAAAGLLATLSWLAVCIVALRRFAALGRRGWVVASVAAPVASVAGPPGAAGRRCRSVPDRRAGRRTGPRRRPS